MRQTVALLDLLAAIILVVAAGYVVTALHAVLTAPLQALLAVATLVHFVIRLDGVWRVSREAVKGSQS